MHVDAIAYAWAALNPQHPWPTQLGDRPTHTGAPMGVETPARIAARAKWQGCGKADKSRRQRTPEERAWMRDYQRRRRAAGKDARGEPAARGAGV